MVNNNLNVVTIISDSLGLLSSSDCSLKDTYPYLPQEKLPEIYVNFKGERKFDTDLLLLKQNIHDKLLNNNSSFVIIHLGIVDCAPRIIGKNELPFFKSN